MSSVQQALKASHEGTLRLGEVEIPCAVLSDGRRVLTAQGMLTAMGRAGKAPRAVGSRVDRTPPFLAAKNLKPFVSPDILGSTNPVAFLTIRGRDASGYPAEALPAACSVYLAARRAGALRENQSHIVEQCEILLIAFASVGITALVDEATGYQKVRADDALQVKLAAYISPHLRPWTKFMPDELWRQFARLEHRTTGPEFRPKYWGHIVNEVVYDALDSDVAQHLRDTRPPSSSSRRFHQWMSEDFGALKLRQHIEQVIAIARTCTTMREFRGRVALAFSHRPAQTFLPLPRAA